MGLLDSIGGFVQKNIGSIIPAAASFLGGERANDASADISSANNAFNAEQAALNRDFQQNEADRARNWQDRKRATQYQDAVEDMKRAGLNPMLAYSQGGAGNLSTSSPSGSAASSAGNPTMRDSISPAIQTAFQVKQLEQSLAVQKAQEEQLKAQTAKTEAETRSERYRLDGSGHPDEKSEMYWRAQEMRENVNLLAEKGRESANHSILMKWQRNLTEVMVDLEQGRLTEVEAHTKLMNIHRQMVELDIPRAKNERDAQDSWWKREVSPYLKDMSGVNSAASAAAGAAAGFGLGIRGSVGRGGLRLPRR